MTRRELVKRAASVVLVMLGTSRVVTARQWDTGPDIIFKKVKDGSYDRPCICWKATHGTERVECIKDGIVIRSHMEPRQFGHFRTLSSDTPTLAELRAILDKFDTQQRDILTALCRGDVSSVAWY